MSCWTDLPPGGTYTLSAYVKADTPGAPFQLFFSEDGATLKTEQFQAGTEWQRFSISFKADTGKRCRTGFNPVLIGAEYHIDAVQLENGERTSAYRVYQNELPGSSVKKAGGFFSAVHAANPPSIDGVLDEDLWKNCVPIPLMNIKKNTPLNDVTNLFIAYDRNYIYFAAVCFTAEMGKIKADIKDHKGKVWLDDCMEFLFRAENGGNSYVQFAVNTIGTKYEGAALADISWRADWDAAVKKYDGRFVTEARIPISALASVGKDGRLYFNVARENHSAAEYSALAAPAKSFLEWKSWPELASRGKLHPPYFRDRVSFRQHRFFGTVHTRQALRSF